MRHCCTKCPETTGHRGRYGGFLHGIPGNLRASGTIGDVIAHDTSEVIGIGNNMRHCCTRCPEIAEHRGRYGGFLHGILENLRVSGTIGDVVVYDTSEVMGIRDNMRHYCTRCPEIMGYRGQYEAL